MAEEMVSVIIPTYNREQVIGRAIKSVLDQTYPHFELLIIDDGSTDQTKHVVEEFADNRIRYIALEKNSGAAHSRNVGIQESRYDYIAFHDSDDEWLPEKLELQMEMMLNSPDKLGAVYCRMDSVSRETGERFVYPYSNWLKEELEGMLFDKLLKQNLIGMPTFLVRRECIDKVGGLKESLMCFEDWEWFLRIAGKYKIGIVDQVLLVVHKMETSVTTVASASGWSIIVRCYLVSKYRQEMIRADVLEDVQEDILIRAKRMNLYEEAKELMTRDDIEL